MKQCEVFNVHFCDKIQNVSCVSIHCSLLDMEYTEGRYAHEMILYLVFEHMEQDLDCYIRRHSPRGLSERTVKVGS